MRAFGFAVSWAVVLPLLVLTGGCRDGSAAVEASEIAVTNSYLEAVVRDLCGPDTAILCLAPPGMCPGHFDISPAQVRQLGRCRMLLLFDFQQKVEASLARLKAKGLRTHMIQGPSGLCVPDSYAATCREVAAMLSAACPTRATELEARLGAIEERLAALGDELRTSVQSANVRAAKVLASNHQAEFARWLGLEVVATFVGSDVETISNIDHCLKQTAGQEIRFVVANQQEGAALAGALADRLGARAVVFSNFPSQADKATGFDRLLRDNVQGLIAAVTP
ncbi:MAG: zinc ABC transporter substrate-binding protein [Sedimentisphaerales bacterium]|jgi:ABC-type Zn uptake system ZnuABC Zn-binding protein ZnuA|nr:zinc ABC transporter substrate-binding protein [Sedimentisphaerales bacterium]HNY79726.1 zinc ABC transporter substrate-binding protein [Sedimentisphaerales bacterium]HOC64767.1 zinc ABC transporter substrate-binding protein [Sedimentisphaerales bacterium]HOH65715.1 zinc ABC transporter substrate-binding protein [Sedimentisphaerales bacterium]HPY50516.1 zinc ABC transporter substrate-binding protein [Sedimentisphaerales bacterium]